MNDETFDEVEYEELYQEIRKLKNKNEVLEQRIAKSKVRLNLNLEILEILEDRYNKCKMILEKERI